MSYFKARIADLFTAHQASVIHRTLLLGRQSPRTSRRLGITILELLIVVASLMGLLSLLLPAIQSAREASRNMGCLSNLHQLGIALQAYEQTHSALPAGWKTEATGASSYGWAAMIMGELEETALDAKIDQARPLQELSDVVWSTTPGVFLCPSDPSSAVFSLFAEIGDHESHAQDSTNVLVTLPHANYIAVFGTVDPDDVPGSAGDGMFLQGHGHRLEEIARGLSHVVLVGERTSRKLPSTWLGIATQGEDAAGRVVGFADLGPNRDDADECEFDSRHYAHVNFLWADGHATSVANDIDRAIYRQSAARH